MPDANEDLSTVLAVVAAALSLALLAILCVVAVLRQPAGIEGARATSELPPESPALAGLLCNDFEITGEVVPATLLDLAARRVVTLEEVQPGRTICRLRRGSSERLRVYEQRVLDTIADRAIDGVVPADALTTGEEDRSRRWRRDLSREVVADAKAQRLTYDRWPATVTGPFVLGAVAVGGLLFAALETGEDRAAAGNVAPVAGGIAIAGAMLLAAILGRLTYSLAQLPTDAGRSAAARCLGIQAHLRENESLDDAPPAAVALWGRHLAYAAALGAASTCVAALPMGAEDDHQAWSRFGGRWRRVRVRYPRARPPGWGKHPGFALFLGLFWVGVALVATFFLLRIANANRDPNDPLLTQEQFDWIGRSALVLCIALTVLLAWGLSVVFRAGPDLWQRQTVIGELVRARTRKQVFEWNRDVEKPWYYLAVDNGASDRLRAWRVRRELFESVAQGDTVTAVVTPRLAYVRSITRS